MASPANSTHVPSRRAFLTHAVASGVAGTQSTIFGAPAAASSLAGACVWAAGHSDWLRKNEHMLDDAGLRAESGRIEAVFHRAVAEPSAGLSDLAAKARMLLEDLIQNDALDEQYVNQKLVGVILRELTALA